MDFIRIKQNMIYQNVNLIIKIKSQPPDNYNAMLSANIINVEPDFDLLGFLSCN